MTQRLEKTHDFVVRRVADEHILVPLRRQIPWGVLVFVLDGPVALRLWELLDGTLTGHELVEVLEGEFEVDRPRAELEVRSFLEQVLTLGAVRPRPSDLTEQPADT